MFALTQSAASVPARVPRAARAAPARRAAIVTRASGASSAPGSLSRRDALLGATASVALLASPSPARALDVGATAPAFTLPSTGGGTVALADVVGKNKYTVLYFYNQDFSQGARSRRSAQPGPRRLQGQGRGGGRREHGPPREARGVLHREGSGVQAPLRRRRRRERVLRRRPQDPHPGEISDRQTFLIDDKGVVVGHWLERDGSMANVKTPAHTTQILDAIGKL